MATTPATTPPVSTIVRQPLGPSSGGFGSTGPPAADADSLRRSNTVGTHRTHQPSASVSSTSAATSAFHGSRANPTSRFRSGSLSSGNNDPGLVRKGSGRAVRPEAAVIESTEEGTTEMGSWGKGLSRQSSLPSRRGINPAAIVPTEPVPQPTSRAPGDVQAVGNTAPRPPRPPRRISVNTSTSAPGPTPGPPSAHAPSHSLSSLASLAMVSPPTATTLLETPAPVTGVSRTQSLRAQAKSMADAGGLGRSASMKAAGEHYRPLHSMSSAMSPPTEPNTPHNPFTPPSPAPASSSAAFPPFHLPNDDQRAASPSDTAGADIKRHQSLTQGYGSSSRVRERLERSPAVLTLHQRDDLRRLGGHSRTISTDQPPTSPIGHSVWSPAQSGDDGWNRPSTQQLQDAFQAMNMGPITGDGGAIRQPQPQPQPQQDPSRVPHLADEPSWVTNLVGHAERISPQPVRTASAPNWNQRDMYGPPVDAGIMPPQWLAQQQSFLGQPYGQGVYQNLLPQGYGGMPMRNGGQPGQPGTPSFAQAFSPYLAQPFAPAYPSPPGTAPLPSEDAAVIELAKQKGLNPATYNCRPAQARFFVIKSYTEEDVQKSLKHEIWSSTVLGNKRLDAAFRESGDQMPIFLFFSVNGSRHFCGVAQMLTSVDESQSSNVWSLDNKWKGIFKVKWIFVRDVPSAALRHIRLVNTPEQKPITNSRDTQELHYEAGCEVLQIFLDHQNKSKTSLLQDFAYYERLSANRPPSAGGQRAPVSLNDPVQPYPGGPNPYQNPSPAHPGQQSMMMPPPLPAGLAMPPHAAHAAHVVPPVPPIPARFR